LLEPDEGKAIMLSLSRFISTSLLAVTSTVFGVACKPVESGDPPPAASCELSPEIPDPTVQWDRLIAGNSDLPPAVSDALRQGAKEEASAVDPCVGVKEGRAVTRSQEEHYRNALKQYQEALSLLDKCTGSCGDRTEIRRRVNDKITLASTALENASDMNRRYFTGPVP